MPQSLSPTCVVIPALNEAGVIGDIVSEIRTRFGLTVIVVDDDSSDGTAIEATASGAHVLSLAYRLGAWGATQAGIRQALKSGFQQVVTLDADGQHPVAHIADLLECLNASGANVVIGACTARGSRARHFAWRLMRICSGIAFEDLTSGYRVYDRAAMTVLADWRATFVDHQDIGVLALLLNNDLEIVEIGVDMKPRANGHSRIFSSWSGVMVYMLHTLVLGASKRSVRRVVRKQE